MPETRTDGSLVNVITGMGTARDKSAMTTVGFASELSELQQQELAQDVFIGRVCSAKPDAATRKWCDITYTNQDEKVIKAFNAYRDTIGGATEDEELISDRELFLWAGYLANVHRGSVILMDVDDGRSPAEPINTKNIRTIKSCQVLDSYKIYPDVAQSLNPWSASHYELLVAQNQGARLTALMDNFKKKDDGRLAYPIHRSRILRIPGVRIPPDVMMRNMGWDRSLIEQLWQTFRDWMSTYQNVNSLIHDYSLFVYALKGLREMVSEGMEDQLRTRFRLLQEMTSTIGGVAIDSEGEKIEFVQRTFAGLDQLMDKFRDLFIGASDIPHTVLFGESPSGLGATGESEEKTWANTVEQYQTRVILPRLRRMYRLIWLAEDGPTNGEEPEGWEINFLPLYQQTESERLAGLSSFVGSLTQGINAGFLLPDEARIPFKGSDSYEIALDEDLWQKKKDEESQAFDFGAMGNETPTEPATEEESVEPEEGGEQLTFDSTRFDERVFDDEKLHQQIVSEAKRKFDPYPSRYAGMWISKEYEKRSAKKRKTNSTRTDGKVIRWNGLDIAVTHEPGSYRFAGSAPMRTSYGRINRSWGTAPDGKSVDCYVNPGFTSEDKNPVYRVTQRNPETFEEDEYKYFFGYPDAKSVTQDFIYHAGHSRFGSVKKVELSELNAYRKDVHHDSDCGCETCAIKAKRKPRGIPKKTKPVEETKTDSSDKKGLVKKKVKVKGKNGKEYESTRWVKPTAIAAGVVGTALAAGAAAYVLSQSGKPKSKTRQTQKSQEEKVYASTVEKPKEPVKELPKPKPTDTKLAEPKLQIKQKPELPKDPEFPDEESLKKALHPIQAGEATASGYDLFTATINDKKYFVKKQPEELSLKEQLSYKAAQIYDMDDMVLPAKSVKLDGKDYVVSDFLKGKAIGADYNGDIDGQIEDLSYKKHEQEVELKSLKSDFYNKNINRDEYRSRKAVASKAITEIDKEIQDLRLKGKTEAVENLKAVGPEKLKKWLLYDYVLNISDRHAMNVFKQGDDLKLIDNALTFNDSGSKWGSLEIADDNNFSSMFAIPPSDKLPKDHVLLKYDVLKGETLKQSEIKPFLDKSSQVEEAISKTLASRPEDRDKALSGFRKRMEFLRQAMEEGGLDIERLKA